jgi:hypothetical protein
MKQHPSGFSPFPNPFSGKARKKKPIRSKVARNNEI